MIKNSIEKIARNIGFDIGNSDDVVQSDLLNGFCEGLANSMTNDNMEKQICYIVDKLSKKSDKVLKIMCDFIELKEKDETLKNK